MPGEKGTTGVPIKVAFVGADDAEIRYANQFVVQLAEREIILLVAQLAPPLLMGTEEEQLSQAKELGVVPIKVLARFGFNLERAEQLRDLLDRQIKLAAERPAETQP